MEFTTDIFTVYDKKWALLTAGNKDKYNTMTISWGGMGTLWGKPVVTSYVRTSRYTHDFMDNEDYFTVSFYPEELRKTLVLLGSKSGKEIDKMNIEGLTGKEIGNSVTFEEAEITLLCRKLFKQRINPENIIDPTCKAFYDSDAEHDMYIGEVVEIVDNRNL